MDVLRLAGAGLAWIGPATFVARGNLGGFSTVFSELNSCVALFVMLGGEHELQFEAFISHQRAA
jgi:hypothetical protein